MVRFPYVLSLLRNVTNMVVSYHPASVLCLKSYLAQYLNNGINGQGSVLAPKCISSSSGLCPVFVRDFIEQASESLWQSAYSFCFPSAK